MKKILFLAVLLCPFLASAQSDQYQLTIKLKDLKSTARAYLIDSYGWTNQKILDSGTLINGSFQFRNKLAEPKKVSLVIDHQSGTYKGWAKNDDMLTFYLEKGELSIDGKDSVKTATFKGGIVNGDYNRYNQTVLSLLKTFNKEAELKLSKATPEQLKDPDLMQAMMGKLKVLNKQTDSLKYIFIKQNPNSFISLVALTEIAGQNVDVKKWEPIFKSLSTLLKNTPFAKEFAKKLYDNGITAVGKLAPDFTQNDVNGKAVKLSDFKGKYILLDFWASWCGPCRAENPTVVAAYHKYKDKNFTVIGVSLDQPGKKEAWLEAIKADGLPWTQVSDLKFWNNEVAKIYEIRAIPQNFLIDPNGKIIAKNLHGDALNEKLASILK